MKAERRCACGELELGGSDERSEPHLVLQYHYQQLPFRVVGLWGRCSRADDSGL